MLNHQPTENYQDYSHQPRRIKMTSPAKYHSVRLTETERAAIQHLIEQTYSETGLILSLSNWLRQAITKSLKEQEDLIL
jgi:hypothetical protein